MQTALREAHSLASLGSFVPSATPATCNSRKTSSQKAQTTVHMARRETGLGGAIPPPRSGWDLGGDAQPIVPPCGESWMKSRLPSSASSMPARRTVFRASTHRHAPPPLIAVAPDQQDPVRLECSIGIIIVIIALRACAGQGCDFWGFLQLLSCPYILRALYEQISVVGSLPCTSRKRLITSQHPSILSLLRTLSDSPTIVVILLYYFELAYTLARKGLMIRVFAILP